ncbi:hypothetical protein [Lacticaseibacillus parakribbianus]|uniref:hypothetical protein n=1 Tax=Lacticaseibacillus parakribbianus TaxID=2970927 RepID=UPI0021CB88E2|nr:hypothetical protein [Lacticaseibacillus parakribbianus]
MLLENQQLAISAASGQLGQVTFYRCQLSATAQDEGQLARLLTETAASLATLSFGAITRLSAKKQPAKPIYSIIGQTATGHLINLVYDFTAQGYTKKLDVAGSAGLYVYDSRADMAFWSDTYQAPLPAGEPADLESPLVAMVQRSLASQAPVQEVEV